MGAYRDHGAGVECHQRCAVPRRKAEAIGVTAGIGKKGRTACLVMGEAVQGNGQFDEFGFDRRIVRFGPRRRRAELVLCPKSS